MAVELPPVAQCAGIPLEYALCINAAEDNASASTEVERIAINVAGGVLGANAGGGGGGPAHAVSAIACLTALFHLMRSLHAHRHGGDLEPINAVLGCAIIVPSSCVRWLADDGDGDADVTAAAVAADAADELGAQRVLDMLVYTVNWMRESISAFVGQANAMIRKKVLLRIGALVRLERLVRAQLRCVPPAYQMPGVQVTANGRTAAAQAAQAATAAAEFKRPQGERVMVV